MIAATYNILADQGATFSRVLTWNTSAGTPVNLNGYTAKMQVRTVDNNTLGIELSTINGRIALGGAAGTITLTVAATDMGFEAGAHVYDLEMTVGTTTTRLVQGSFELRPEVTV
jgi:hypothetical protein